MQKLLINNFSLQVHTEFERPIPEDQANLTTIADKMVEAFPYVLRTDDISIDSDKKPYGYRLLCKLFSGSAEVALASKSIVSSFRDGRTDQALRLVAKSVETIYRIVVEHPVQFNQLTFAFHAQFESAESYAEYMVRFADPDKGYLSGGRILQGEARTLKGEVRFSTEKSSTQDNAIFVSTQFLTQEAITNESLDQMAKRFVEIAAYEGLEFNFPK